MLHVPALRIFTVLAMTLPRRCSGEAEPSIVQEINCHITVADRLSKTTVQKTVWNTSNRSLETMMQLFLPDNAYITAMQAKSLKSGKVVYGSLVPKDKGLLVYKRQRQDGFTVGIVQVKRNSGVYEVRVNTAANDIAVFTITYEEMLARRLGLIGQTLHLSEQSFVAEVNVDVEISDTEQIQRVRALLDRNNSEIIPVTKRNGTLSFNYRKLYNRSQAANVTFTFGYEYSVRDTPMSGLVHYEKAFFVHYLAPDWLPVLPKSMVFVIDVSGSMKGMKLQQSKASLEQILRTQLSLDDSFALLTFNSDITTWKQTLVAASEDELSAAVDYVAKLSAGGSTDINKALLTAFQFFDKSLEPSHVPIIVFLTDGEPTDGVVDTWQIRWNVRTVNSLFALLFCLAFGNDANMKLLRQLAYENGGTARSIREDSNTILHFTNIVKEVSAPLMRNVHISYKNVSYATRIDFPVYFHGSEILIVGKIHNHVDSRNELEFTLSYNTSTTNSTVMNNAVKTTHSVREGSVQRLFAHKRCHELYNQYLVEENEEANATWNALLNISLTYGLVTPATAMVIIQTNDSLPTNHSDWLKNKTGKRTGDILQSDDGDQQQDNWIIVQGGPPVIHGAADLMNSDSDSKSSVIGGSVGGVCVGFLLSVTVVVVVRRWQRRNLHRTNQETETEDRIEELNDKEMLLRIVEGEN